MAGAKVPAPLDPMVDGDDWTNILARLERTYKGYDGVSLTEWAAGNTTRPEVAAGSVIEIDGSPFYYASDETIVDEAGLTDGWCYVKHVVSGDAVTPTLTNTFGTWDTAKQGFYDGTDRYSLFAMYRSGAITKIFTDKDIMKLPEAILGYRYYTKPYTGTVGGGASYAISFTDTAFATSQVISAIDRIVLTVLGTDYYTIPVIGGYITLGTTAGTVSYTNNTGVSGYSGKAFQTTIIYKLTL